MRRLAALLTALLLLAGCASVPPLPPQPPAANFAYATFNKEGRETRYAKGLADRATQRALEPADPARIASVSKLVVALGVMRLVEAGTLNLDRDVSHWLGWRLRNPAFPDAPITLRLLLSHTSGLRDEVDYIVPLGQDLRTALAAPAAFDPKHPPGAYFTYSNLNFPVVATVMEAATGERFDRLMEASAPASTGRRARRTPSQMRLSFTRRTGRLSATTLAGSRRLAPWSWRRGHHAT